MNPRTHVKLVALAIAGLAAVIVTLAGLYTVAETEQIIITQFGKPTIVDQENNRIGDPVIDAGLHFRIPFIQTVNRIEKRALEWDGRPTEMPTKDKTYILVDTFARWRISDPLQYFQRLTDERSAQSRLDDILGSETRNAVAKHELIEAIRTSKDRQPAVEEVLPDEIAEHVSTLYPIKRGRALLEQDIFDLSKEKLAVFGIELLDIRFKRINYNPTVREKIYLRMISERKQIADRFRSEGAGEAARIIGNKERDLKKIESEAYKAIQTVRGDADASAAEIYSNAYDQSDESREFFSFIKTMETYQDVMNQNSMLILSTDSDLFRFLKEAAPNDLPSQPVKKAEAAEAEKKE